MISFKRYKNKSHSIFTKITILTISFVILSSIISSTILIFQFSERLKDKDRLLVSEAANRIEDFTRTKYNMTFNQHTLLHSTDYVASIISATRDHPTEIYQSQNLSKITEYLNALTYSDSSICDSILFTADGENAFSHSNGGGRKIYVSYNYATLPYIQEFSKSSDTITAIYDSDPPYLTLSSGKTSPGVISFIAKIYDMNYPTKQIVTGYMIINFSLDSIDDTYNDIESSADGTYLIVNGTSDIIYSNERKLVGTQYTDDLIPAPDIIMDKSISLSGLRVIAAVSDNILQKNINLIIWRLTLVTSCCILCLIITITMLHKYYRKRFQQLEDAMVQFSNGDFEVRLSIDSADEIGSLSRGFNVMSDTLDSYIKKTYLAETQKKTAELYALQTQIQPHFLANTIESIRMKAMEEDDYDVAEMLSNLGNLFRWMIQFHQNIVYLEDETSYIESYLELQKFRFGDRIRVTMDIPSETLYLGVPRFTLQPIVENAITHSLSQNPQPLHIIISCSIQADHLVLVVKDDGLGMENEILNKLRLHIQGATEESAFGVALRNVHTRIQILFGDAYGLSIDSCRYRGTTVTVTLPAMKKEVMEEQCIK
ncbi:MAG: sensor histidine kinase [Hespellia sp.]|nr:sensor histidine kinase [Hespellia sp.]